jgi:hypothetical protein
MEVPYYSIQSSPWSPCFSDAVLLRLPLHMMSMSIHVFFLIPEKISIFLLNTKDSVKVVILMCFKGDLPADEMW